MSCAIPILACSSRSDAELARSFFSAYGLEVFLKTDDFGGLHPPLTFFHEVILQVRESEASKADALLDSVDDYDPHQCTCPPEYEQLRQELWKAVRGVIIGVFILPLILQPFALLRAFRVMRQIGISPHATRAMRNQIRGAVMVSSIINIIVVFQVFLLFASDYLVLWGL